LLSFAGLKQVHRCITDKLPDDADLIQACEVAGIAIVVA
jgi:hypothetical protein